MWIANAGDGTVSRIDRERDEGVTIPVGGEPAALAFGGGSLWVADGASREVAQVDPGANKAVQRYEVGNAPRALAVAAGACGWRPASTGACRGIDLGRGRMRRRSRSARTRPRSRPAPARSGWPARRPGP